MLRAQWVSCLVVACVYNLPFLTREATSLENKTMQNRQSKPFRRGMTLVELLVVVAIMVMLLAVSVPMLKPMLESRKTNNAAHVLAGAFRLARTKSIQEQQSYCVRLTPYMNAPTVALQLPMQKKGVIEHVNPPHVRVRVERGKIVFYCFDKGTWQIPDPSNLFFDDDLQAELVKAQKHFSSNGSVQFNRLGRSFTFSVIEGVAQLSPPYDGLILPEVPMDAMEYRVSRPSAASLSWLSPTVMPQGTVVDLMFSGGETVNFAGNEKTLDDFPAAFSAGDEVVVVFSPAGHVDFLHINGEAKNVNEMLYFCVGEWHRQMDAANGGTLADDKKTNLDVPATYWVTLHPKTGIVRITENAPVKSVEPLERLKEARKFAREHFFDVGGE